MPASPSANVVTASGAPAFIVRAISRRASVVSGNRWRDPQQIAPSKTSSANGSSGMRARERLTLVFPSRRTFTIPCRRVPIEKSMPYTVRAGVAIRRPVRGGSASHIQHRSAYAPQSLRHELRDALQRTGIGAGQDLQDKRMPDPAFIDGRQEFHLFDVPITRILTDKDFFLQKVGYAINNGILRSHSRQVSVWSSESSGRWHFGQAYRLDF